MRAGLLVMLAACGRIDFDPHADAGGSTAFSCPGNIMPDPQFELGLANWSSDSDASYAHIMDMPYSGAFAGRACRNVDGFVRDYGVRGTLLTLPDVSIGARYRITAVMRLSLTTTGGIRIRLRSATDQIDTADSLATVDTAWTAVSGEYAIPVAGAERMLVEIEGINGPGDATYCVDADDVCVQLE